MGYPLQPCQAGSNRPKQRPAYPTSTIVKSKMFQGLRRYSLGPPAAMQTSTTSSVNAKLMVISAGRQASQCDSQRYRWLSTFMLGAHAVHESLWFAWILPLSDTHRTERQPQLPAANQQHLHPGLYAVLRSLLQEEWFAHASTLLTHHFQDLVASLGVWLLGLVQRKGDAVDRNQQRDCQTKVCIAADKRRVRRLHGYCRATS